MCCVNIAVYAQSGVVRYIPAGYEILDSASGNLNLDDKPDMILVLRKIDEYNIHDNPPRRSLLILTGKGKNKYRLYLKSEGLIYTHNMGGISSSEPFSSVEITNGYFSILHSGGMGSSKWNFILQFRYDRKAKEYYLERKQSDTYTLVYDEDNNDLNAAGEATEIKTAKDFGLVKLKEVDVLVEEVEE